MNEQEIELLKQILDTDLEIDRVVLHYDFAYKLPYRNDFFTTSELIRRRKIQMAYSLIDKEQIIFIRNGRELMLPINQLINYQRYLKLQAFQ